MYSCNYEPILSRLTLILNSRRGPFFLQEGTKFQTKQVLFERGEGAPPFLTSTHAYPYPWSAQVGWKKVEGRTSLVLITSKFKTFAISK